MQYRNTCSHPIRCNSRRPRLPSRRSPCIGHAKMMLAPRIVALRGATPLNALVKHTKALALARPARKVHSLRPSTVVVRAVAAPEAASPAPPFQQLGLAPELLQALQEKGLSEATEIQAAAVPELLRDRKSDFLIASHTGSGKTLAYLLPIVHCLKEAEMVAGVPTKPRRPRALVLGPTRELTEQIYGVARQLAHAARFRPVLATGGGDMGSQRSAMDRPLDVLVATPTRLAQHAQRANVYYGDVEVVVLDEADTMLDRGFGPEVAEILKAVRSKPQPARCILVSATMTKGVRRLIGDQFPGLRTVETSSLHRGVAGARHSFLPLEPGADRLDLLMQVVAGEQARGKRIMVFCNTLGSCRAADHHLREQGLATVCYHGDVPLEQRRDAILRFAAAEEGEAPPLLVATDLAARGLDIPGSVDHVVNFDFPLNPVDYLHRTGRTARAGATGRVTSLVTKADRVLASRIEEALTKNLPLDALSGDRAVLPDHMRPKEETMQRRNVQRKADAHARKGSRGVRRGEATGRGGSAGGSGSRGGGNRFGQAMSRQKSRSFK